MTPQTDVDAVRHFLARAWRRVALLLAIHGATTGVWVALATTGVLLVIQHGAFVPPLYAAVGFAILGVAVGLVRARMLRPRIASIVEGQTDKGRNLLVTAGELIAGTNNTTPYVTDIVQHNAAELVQSLDIGALFPIRGALTALVISTAFWLFVATRHPAAAGVGAVNRVGSNSSVAINGVDATVVLPPYVRQTRPALHDPVRIEAFIGSTIRITVHANADAVTLETLHGKQTLKPSADGTFSGVVAADLDGFIALEPSAAGKTAGARRLIGVSVLPDLPPRVHITAPAKDLKLPDGKQSIQVAIEADDDLGLASLHLRYTRVSGSGERYTFTEGEVPLTITRNDKRTWHARAAWHLDSLALAPGDMVVYRAVAADDRPGATPTESDAWIAEVSAPGGVAGAGFALDPEIERYALSEQMVILKTEQLNARKPKMTTDSFADAAAEIASEQRRVRAEFVFMMGGEVGTADDPSVDMTTDLNEVAETEASGDLAAARQGRVALVSAIRLMSRADKALTAADLVLALTHERAALVQLERTFAHTKIILRALTERERLDLTRRLGGSLADAARDVRAAAQPPSDMRTAALRQALGEIAIITSGDTTGRAARITTLAERVLRIDPAAVPLQHVSQSLIDASAATSRGRVADAHALLDSAAVTLARTIRSDLLDAPHRTRSLDEARLAGALNDAVHRPKGTP